MTDITHVILDLDGTLINTGARRADRPFPSAPGRPGVVGAALFFGDAFFEDDDDDDDDIPFE